MASGSRDTPLTLMQFAFAAGIDESVRDEVVEPTSGFLVLENVRQSKLGAVSKRSGFAQLTKTRLDATTRSAGYAMFPYGEQVCVIDGHTLDAYSSVTGRNVNRDRVPECLPKRVPLPYPGGTPWATDVVYANGYYVLACVATRQQAGSAVVVGLHVSVVDATTLTVVAERLLSSTMHAVDGMAVRLVNIGNTVVVVYSGTAATLHGRTLDVTSAATIATGWSSVVALAAGDWLRPTSSDCRTSFDVHGMSDRFALAYVNTSGGVSQTTVKTFNAALTGLASTTILSSTPRAIGLAGSTSDAIWLGWNEGTTFYVMGLSAALTATYTIASTTLKAADAIGLIATGTGTALAVVSVSGLTGGVTITYVVPISSAAGASVIGTPLDIQRCVATTRPFAVDGRYYCGVVPIEYGVIGNTQRCHFVVDLDHLDASARPVANLSARQSLMSIGTAAATGGTGGMLSCHVATVSSTKVAIVNATVKSFLSVNTGAALELAELDFASSARWCSSEYGGNVVLSGGTPSSFDGVMVDELGFVLRPDPPTVASKSASVTRTLTNVLYVAIYEKTDSSGNVSWSAPSDPSAFFSVTNDNADVTVTTLRISSHNDDLTALSNNTIRIAIYRSGNSGALPYRRVAAVENGFGTTITYEDDQIDVSSNQALYTQPGQPGTEQVHQCPPALRLLTVYNDMLVGVADDGVTLWYSAQRAVGEAPWFNDIFQLPIAEGGDVTALASLDGSLFVFKQRAIFALSGVAPTGNGTQGGLGDPRRLAADAGAVSHHACATSLGIFFASERGIELLTRAQTVEWIGEKVQATYAAFPVVTGITLDVRSNVVLIELAASESAGLATGSGRTLVYDLTIKAWVSVDRRTNASGTADTPAQAGAIVYTGSAWRYAWLESDGTVHYENTNTCLDGGSYWVTMRAETAWVKGGGLQGRHHANRVLALAKSATSHDVGVSLAYDYSASYKTARLYTAAQLAALSTPLMQIEHSCHDEARGEAIRVKLADATPSSGSVGTGQGSTWIGLTFEVVPQPGAFQLPDSAR